MIHSRAVEMLGELEQKFPVATWMADGIHFWPLLRVKLGKSILAAARREAKEAQPETLPSAGERLSQRLGSARRLAVRGGQRFADRHNTLHRVPRADALFWSRPANRQLLDTGWYDRFFDPIQEVLAARSRTTLTLEKPDRKGIHRFPRHGPSMLVRSAVGRRKWAATLDFVSKRPDSVAGYEDFRRELSAAFPGASMWSWSRMMREVRYVKRLARYFGDILDRSGARVAFATYYYNPMVMALCLAAHARGIPCVDIQHGVNRLNPAYEGWTAFPEGGYPLLPTHFWSWSAYDAEPVGRWPEAVRDVHRAVVGGHPWMAFWQGDGPLTRRYREKVAALRGGGINVLVSLTWQAKLSPLLRELFQKSPPDWTWWIRLHPLMDEDRHQIAAWCRTRFAARAIVEESTDLPLPLLLDQADVHLTHNSSVVQEATAMGLPSVAIDEKALDMFPSQIESGWLRYETETDSIIEAVGAQATGRTSLPDADPYPSLDEMARTVDTLFE